MDWKSVGMMTFPTEWKVIKFMFQTSNQSLFSSVNHPWWTTILTLDVHVTWTWTKPQDTRMQSVPPFQHPAGEGAGISRGFHQSRAETSVFFGFLEVFQSDFAGRGGWSWLIPASRWSWSPGSPSSISTCQCQAKARRCWADLTDFCRFWVMYPLVN